MELDTWARLPLPDDFSIPELLDPLHSLPQNLDSLLSTFSLNASKSNTDKLHFAQDDPFKGLPISHKDIELPWEKVKREFFVHEVKIVKKAHHFSSSSDSSGNFSDCEEELETHGANLASKVKASENEIKSLRKYVL